MGRRASGLEFHLTAVTRTHKQQRQMPWTVETAFEFEAAASGRFNWKGGDGDLHCRLTAEVDDPDFMSAKLVRRKVARVCVPLAKAFAEVISTDGLTPTLQPEAHPTEGCTWWTVTFALNKPNNGRNRSAEAKIMRRVEGLDHDPNVVRINRPAIADFVRRCGGMLHSAVSSAEHTKIFGGE